MAGISPPRRAKTPRSRHRCSKSQIGWFVALRRMPRMPELFDVEVPVGDAAATRQSDSSRSSAVIRVFALSMRAVTERAAFRSGCE